jgi:flotillin
MSKEKLRFKIPAALTIGPDLDDPNNMQRYVRLLITAGDRKAQEKVIRERVNGIVEGEMRAVAASMPIEEIYNNRKEFRGRVVEYIQTSLTKFGLELYNANIKELIDESGYFAAIGMKASEGNLLDKLLMLLDTEYNRRC